jgi:hypothetical protein
MAGTSASKATPFFEPLCPAMTSQAQLRVFWTTGAMPLNWAFCSSRSEP